MLRNLIKTDFKEPELIVDLIEGVSLLSKNFFTKQIGIDPMLMKGFMPLLPYLIKEQNNLTIKVAAIKALGSFISQACAAPVRMINFFKELVDQGIVEQFCQIVSTASDTQTVSPVHLVTVHTLSILCSPFYGDTFSFPWKRNPLEGFNEYQEIMP